MSLEHRVALIELALIDMGKALNKMRDGMRQQAQLDMVAASEHDGFTAALSRDTTALREAMVATFRKVTGRPYVFQGAKDAMAMKRLGELRLADAAMLARWESALRMGHAAPVSIAHFAQKFNAYPGPVDMAPPPVKTEPPY